jgi:hypothetical protein
MGKIPISLEQALRKSELQFGQSIKFPADMKIEYLDLEFKPVNNLKAFSKESIDSIYYYLWGNFDIIYRPKYSDIAYKYAILEREKIIINPDIEYIGIHGRGNSLMGCYIDNAPYEYYIVMKNRNRTTDLYNRYFDSNDFTINFFENDHTNFFKYQTPADNYTTYKCNYGIYKYRCKLFQDPVLEWDKDRPNPEYDEYRPTELHTMSLNVLLNYRGIWTTVLSP